MNVKAMRQVRIKNMDIIVKLAEGWTQMDIARHYSTTKNAPSVAINRVESALGVAIFERTKGRRIRPKITAEGAGVVAKFRQILAILDDEPMPVGNVTQMGYDGSLLVSFDSTEARDKAAAAGQCRYTLFGEPV